MNTDGELYDWKGDIFHVALVEQSYIYYRTRLVGLGAYRGDPVDH